MKNDNDIGNMMCLDIYLSSLDDSTYRKVSKNLRPANVYPLMSVDIAGNGMMRLVRDKDRAKLAEFSARFNWESDFDDILTDYEALVLTDINQTIIWASEGFKKMTGYAAHYAIGQKPSFLQGANTNPETRKSIREKLLLEIPFTETIVNYRKNGEEYRCQVSIFPVKSNGTVTHFLALEKEV